MANIVDRVLNLLTLRRPTTRSINFPPQLQSTSPRVIIAKSVDYHITENGFLHHTSMFEHMTRPNDPILVIRRGRSFSIDIEFNRPFQKDIDDVALIFTAIGVKKPSRGHKTLVPVPVYFDMRDHTPRWVALVTGQSGNSATINVSTSADSIIGMWRIDVDTRTRDHGAHTYLHPIPFYLLFNPWSELDVVYLNNAEQRDEYVLKDSGFICRGSDEDVEMKPWQYSQYKKGVLDIVMYLIFAVGKVPVIYRNSPVHIARALAAAINGNDNNGVLESNWKSDYNGGKPPFYWMGSLEILQSYFKSKKSVKFGQCWVFAGVLTTVLRAIGIPCRPVTNYGSAHNTEGSLDVNIYVNDKGDELDDATNDSIWNFHVWNEIWMKRPDLDDRYEGWQAIDATLQQDSEGLSQYGPASLAAIGQNDLEKFYDVGLMFAEVNAREVHWKYSGPGCPHKQLSILTDTIGKVILTKMPGRWTFMDITSTYKYSDRTNLRSGLAVIQPTQESSEVSSQVQPTSDETSPIISVDPSPIVSEDTSPLASQDASQESRIPSQGTVVIAGRCIGVYLARFIPNGKLRDIKIEFVLSPIVEFGQNLKVLLVLENLSSDKQYRISGFLKLKSILYTGKPVNVIKSGGFYHVIKPLSREEVNLDIPFSDYYKLMDPQGYFKVYYTAKALDTVFDFYEEKRLRLRKPTIKLSLLGTPMTGKEIEVTLELRNPLLISLTSCEFRIEGSGLDKQFVQKLKKNVQPDNFASATIKVTPPFSGNHLISAKFMSREMQDVDGSLNFSVTQL